MKTKKQLITIFGTFLVLSFVLLSCSTSRKSAISCPDISIRKQNKVAFNHKVNKAFTAHYRINPGKQPVRLSRKNQRKEITVLKNSRVQDDFIITTKESVSDLHKIEYSKGLSASIDNVIIPVVWNNPAAFPIKNLAMSEQPKDLVTTQPSGCDTIVLKSGSLLVGKVEEIAPNEIKYRKCNNLTGPLISILKSDVSVIIYSNGSHDFITSPSASGINPKYLTTSYSAEPPKSEGLGLAGFIASLVGLFIAGIPLGLIAVIFGCISLSKIKRNPEKYRGKGLAIASIIIGIIAFVGAIIVVASM